MTWRTEKREYLYLYRQQNSWRFFYVRKGAQASDTVLQTRAKNSVMLGFFIL
jgi:Pyruvate/2-oxoacid:ferredoxin oxidoreductase gamma subunit